MGAGAGYTIEVKDCVIKTFFTFNIDNVDADGIEISCEGTVVGDIRGESYYYGCPWIEDVYMTITHMYVPFDKFINSYRIPNDMLTYEGKK